MCIQNMRNSKVSSWGPLPQSPQPVSDCGISFFTESQQVFSSLFYNKKAPLKEFPVLIGFSLRRTYENHIVRGTTQIALFSAPQALSSLMPLRSSHGRGLMISVSPGGFFTGRTPDVLPFGLGATFCFRFPVGLHRPPFLLWDLSRKACGNKPLPHGL